MSNRREFLQGATLTALPLAAGLSYQAGADVRAPLALGAVLIDERHAESRAFGTRLAARGAAVRAVRDGDVTQLWLNEIGPAWRHGPVAVAGLTRRPVLFCLEQLAWQHNLRVVFHAEHIVEAGSVRHEVFRCSARAVPELARLGSRWPHEVADFLATPRQPHPQVRGGPSCAGLEPALAPGAELLTSWLIAAA
jgi:hypothetical protein